MNIRSLRIAALTAAVLSIGGALSAQMPGPNPAHGHGPMGEGHGFKGLNLTTDQQAKVKAIHESHQAAFKAKGEEARAAHKALGEAMANDATDAKTLRTLHDAAAAAQFELLLEHRAVRQEILPLLSADQKALFNKHPMGMSPHHGHGMGPGFGGPMHGGSRHGGPGPEGMGPDAPPVKPS
ncbi:hypothetical protein GETHLI_18470 [Geothrix limicola]|uniref:Periplasmic heavy metal sensor n=1 Tax=Geothrix limicola TaxID=2927978 RepID=A0ABQ5QER9_9BACT|nr:Spy/CpxP family protein refolding chaperone [Geothrix limicola]GLH73345.1 hypothetical protein GETHLI_18470 [Geothrix limicola]